MDSGDNEIEDKRLANIYKELAKYYKFKFETWATMLKTPSFSVRTITYKNKPIVCN